MIGSSSYLLSKTLLSAVLGLLANVGVVEGGLQSTSTDFIVREIG